MLTTNLPSRRRGLTLLELLLVLVLIVIIVSVTMPGLLGMAGRNEVKNGTEQVRTALIQTRNAAMRSGTPRLLLYCPASGFFASVSEPIDEASAAELQTTQMQLRQWSQTNARVIHTTDSPSSAGRTSRTYRLPTDVVFMDSSQLCGTGSPFASAGNATLSGGSSQNSSAASSLAPASSGDMASSVMATNIEFPHVRFEPDGTSNDNVIVVANASDDQIPIVVRGLTGTVEIGQMASRENPYVAGGAAR